MVAPRQKTARQGDKDEEQFLGVRKLQQQYLDYLQTKSEEIEEQKEARRYYHGAHWTADQIRILRKRHQPPLTWNRIARKINAIVGLVERGRSDPKALPRHIKSEAGADIATQVIRYVLDENDWKGIDPWCLLQSCIDGIAGVQMVLTEGDQKATQTLRCLGLSGTNFLRSDVVSARFLRCSLSGHLEMDRH